MRLGFGLIAIALIGGCATNAPITGVSVRDAQFDVVKNLPAAELSEFQRQWESKQVVETRLSDGDGEHFNIDIEQDGSGGRWLYTTTGHVQKLSMRDTPVYKLANPETFNKIIGAHKEVAEPGVAPDVSGRDGLE